ncbi:MAG: SACOL1771 family peroxiredoxin [Caryophanon sp.]|nr:SACOL1771 family peroxiredoxin [Caryophanon sp.]
MAIHNFQLHATWTGGRNDAAMIHAGNLQTMVSIPPEMDGPGIGTNPDEMLLGAAATCYMITLAAMLERSGIDATIALQSTAQVDVTKGVFTYKSITHTPTISVRGLTEQLEAKVSRYAHKAEETCMISKALRGNVAISVSETIEAIVEDE